MQIDQRNRSKASQGIYALCYEIVEQVFRQIKGARCLDRFRLRGLEKVYKEWVLVATRHNLLKLFRALLTTA